jgi:hypothetical protein
LIAATTVRIDAFREPEIIDALHVLERAMHHFFIWVEIGKTRAAKMNKLTRTTSKLPRLLRW